PPWYHSFHDGMHGGRDGRDPSLEQDFQLRHHGGHGSFGVPPGTATPSAMTAPGTALPLREGKSPLPRRPRDRSEDKSGSGPDRPGSSVRSRSPSPRRARSRLRRYRSTALRDR